MKKSDVNNILKKLGLGFAKMSTGYMGPEKCVTVGGKRVKGIYASSYGPMTVTDVYKEFIDEKMANIKSALVEAGMVENEDGYMVIGKLKLLLSVEWLRAYAYSAGMDEGYKNIYIVPRFV